MPAEALTSPALHANGAPGWFGKLPSLGDFASRRLPDAFVHAWDEWLQQGLAHAAGAFDARWRDGAGASRFWLSAGVLGEPGRVGLLLPSRDRVGRRFPLTIVQPLPPQSQGLAVALASRAWLDAVEHAACGVVQAQLSLARLEDELARIAVKTPLADGDAVTAGQLAAAVLADRGVDARGCSVWWNSAAREPSDYLCVAALPSPAVLAALLAGPLTGKQVAGSTGW